MEARDFHVEVSIGRVVMGKDAACRDECPATLKPPIANRLNRVNEYGSAVCHDTSSVTGHSASRSVADDLAVPLKEI
jgi:hypothetical protein